VPASQPTHLSVRGRSADLSRDWTEAVGPQFSEKKCTKSAISAISLLITCLVADPSPVFHLVSPVTNGTIILPARQVLVNVPSILRRLSHLASDGVGRISGGCGVSQVVKTAQSRGRTERTLLKALSQLRWPDKGREVWSRPAGTTKRPVASRISCGAALAENNDVRLSSRKVACGSVVPTTSTGNPGSVYTNCETAYAVISALRRRALTGRRNAAERRNGEL
jgi:hypothetical protein